MFCREVDRLHLSPDNLPSFLRQQNLSSSIFLPSGFNPLQDTRDPEKTSFSGIGIQFGQSCPFIQTTKNNSITRSHMSLLQAKLKFLSHCLYLFFFFPFPRSFFRRMFAFFVLFFLIVLPKIVLTTKSQKIFSPHRLSEPQHEFLLPPSSRFHSYFLSTEIEQLRWLVGWGLTQRWRRLLPL